MKPGRKGMTQGDLKVDNLSEYCEIKGGTSGC
jgi:hypothetical protein